MQLINSLQQTAREYENHLSSDASASLELQRLKEIHCEQQAHIEHLERIIEEKSRIQLLQQQEIESFRTSTQSKEENNFKRIRELEMESQQLKSRFAQQQAQSTMLTVETSTYRAQIRDQEKSILPL